MLAAGLLPSARADNQDTLQLSARHESLHDSNLFRVPSSSSVSARSDTVQTTTLGLQLDKRYSLQRFELDANLVRRAYQRYDYLSYNALDYRGAWTWAATPRVRGTLLNERTTRSNSVTNISNTSQRNLRRDDNLRLDGEADLGAAVRLVGAVDQKRQSNEQVVLEDRDSRVRDVMGGVRYVFPSGSTVGYGLRVGRGEYLNRRFNASTRLPTSFGQTENEVVGRWNWSGKTSLSGRMSYLQRHHDDTPERDFSLPLGEVRMRWAPTGKLRLDAFVSRGYRVTQTDYASYAVGRRIGLTPSWDATAHVQVRLQLEHWAEAYRGGVAGRFTEERDDITRLARLSVDWRPRDFVTLSLLLQTEHRRSSYNTFGYTTNGAGVSAQVQF